MSQFNFDEVIDRRNTGSYKWDSESYASVLPMWVADMDFKAATCITEALKERIENHPVFGYALAPDSLYETIQKYLKNTYQWDVDKNWIVWLPGLETSFTVASKTRHTDDAAVFYLSPIYPPFYTGPKAVGKKTHAIPVNLYEGTWKIDFDKFESLLKEESGPKTLLFCNPHNPIGKVYSMEELEKLSSLCLMYDVLMVSDEVHCDLILDSNKKHIPIATLNSDILKKTITLMAASKTYNIAGLGCGFAIIPDEQVRQSYKINMRGHTAMVNPFGFIAAEAAYKNGESWRLELIDYLNENLTILKDFFDKFDQCHFHPPEASFLAWVDCSDLKLDNTSAYFKSHGVAFSPGEHFGSKGWIRINFACPKSTLIEGLKRFEEALKQI